MGSVRVTVVIPTYNRATLVGRAIESVLEQTFEDFELIVVDDASEDETPEVVREVDDHRLQFIRHDENEYGSAWNTGIEQARGSYVAFLDDDDEWYPRKLEKQVECFDEADDSVGLVYCWREVYEYGELVNEARPDLRGDIFERTLVSNPIGNTSTFLIDADVLDDVGGFDESLPCGLDTDLLRRITAKYDVEYVPELLVKQHWKHDHEQITDDDIENLYETVESHKATLEKFDSRFDAYPRRRAELYSVISGIYCQTRDWPACLYFALRVVVADPFSRDTRADLAGVGRRVLASLGIGKYVPNPRKILDPRR